MATKQLTRRQKIFAITPTGCKRKNIRSAKELLENVLDQYQTYPKDFLGKQPKGWFTSKKPHKLYGIKFSRKDISELAQEMCRADRNVPAEDIVVGAGFSDIYAKHAGKARKVLMRKIVAKKRKK